MRHPQVVSLTDLSENYLMVEGDTVPGAAVAVEGDSVLSPEILAQLTALAAAEIGSSGINDVVIISCPADDKEHRKKVHHAVRKQFKYLATTAGSMLKEKGGALDEKAAQATVEGPLIADDEGVWNGQAFKVGMLVTNDDNYDI